MFVPGRDLAGDLAARDRDRGERVGQADLERLQGDVVFLAEDRQRPGPTLGDEIIASREDGHRSGLLFRRTDFDQLGQLPQGSLPFVAEADGVAGLDAASLDGNDLDVEGGDLLRQTVDLVDGAGDLRVDIVPDVGHPFIERLDRVGQRLTLEDDQVPRGSVVGLVDDVLQSTEERGQLGADVGVAQLADDPLQFPQRCLLGLRTGDVRPGSAEPFLEELVDLLDDGRRLDAEAELEIAAVLDGRRGEDGFLTDVVRRVDVGHVVANDLQTGLGRLKGSRGDLQ